MRTPSVTSFWSALLLLEEHEAVAIGISENELPIPGGLALRLPGGLQAFREHRLMELLDVIDLDVEEGPSALGRGAGPILGDQRHEEPVHVERHPVRLLLALAEPDRVVELGRLRKVPHVTRDPRDAVHVHLAPPFSRTSLTSSAPRTARSPIFQAATAGDLGAARAPRVCPRPE